MWNSLKKLFFSNKYSLLVLLILSLWLKIAKDYYIFLSYIVLIVLYLIVGVVVEIVLDKFFPGFNATPIGGGRWASNDEKEDAGTEVPETVRKEVRTAQPSVNRAAVKRETSVTEVPVRRTQIDTSKIEDRAKQMDSDRHSGRTAQQEAVPKVTSSYIKNAGGMPREMEKKLIRTAADFNSIKNNSDNIYTGGERVPKRVFGNAQNPFVNNEELYTNKKESKVQTEETERRNENTIPEERIAPAEKVRPSARSIDYESMDDYKMASSDELDKISEDISHEVDRRVSTQHPQRRPKMILPDDMSETVNEPVRRTVRPDLYASARREPPVKSEDSDNVPNDKVSADMEKIDRLFNRNRASEEEEEPQNKNGLFGRFKKKR